MSNRTTLSELGISRDQASKWMQMAAIPEAQFEALLKTEGKPSTAGILRAAGQVPRPVMYAQGYDDLNARIDAFQLRMGFATRDEAVYWLLTWALDKKLAPKGE